MFPLQTNHEYSIYHLTLVVTLMRNRQFYKSSLLCFICCSWLILPRIQTVLNNPVHMDKAYAYKFLHPWLGTGLLTR